MDLLLLSVVIISILAGLMFCLYILVLREYCLHAQLDAADPIDPVASTAADSGNN